MLLDDSSSAILRNVLPLGIVGISFRFPFPHRLWNNQSDGKALSSALAMTASFKTLSIVLTRLFTLHSQEATTLQGVWGCIEP